MLFELGLNKTFIYLWLISRWLAHSRLQSFARPPSRNAPVKDGCVYDSYEAYTVIEPVFILAIETRVFLGFNNQEQPLNLYYQTLPTSQIAKGNEHVIRHIDLEIQRFPFFPVSAVSMSDNSRSGQGKLLEATGAPPHSAISGKV